MKNVIQNPNQKVVITFDGNQTLARIYEDNKVVSKGVAICCEEDEFDIKAGSELALTRALEAMKPKIEPNKVEWVKVNRKPRVGDYVRIVNPCFNFDRKGDIIRVYNVRGNTVDVKAKDHANRDKYCMFHGEEYVWHYTLNEVEVVEPATEKQEWVVVNRDPRAGDYVRLKEAWFSFDRQGDILKVVEACGQAFTIRACEHPNYQHDNCKKNGANFDWCYPNWKVEVVEHAPKKPEFRKITREPKVGDYVKIRTSCYLDIDKPGNIYKIDVVDGKCIGIKHCNHPAMKKWYKENDCEHRINDDFIWWYSTVLNHLEFLEKV